MYGGQFDNNSLNLGWLSLYREINKANSSKVKPQKALGL